MRGEKSKMNININVKAKGLSSLLVLLSFIAASEGKTNLGAALILFAFAKEIMKLMK